MSTVLIFQVLQRRIEHRFLDMYPDPKCIGSSIARIEVHCLSTVPWERDPISSSHKASLIGGEIFSLSHFFAFSMRSNWGDKMPELTVTMLTGLGFVPWKQIKLDYPIFK
ncbi:unnamed protein product [Rodentolepis nana]|uniref:Cytochrome P450 n=1 Tax=Rodentolepis nana TaxID=102285 RepID=A0A0R3T0N8_RODNA|nr:unnamed protein product [Rodentolepis nana]